MKYIYKVSEVAGCRHGADHRRVWKCPRTGRRVRALPNHLEPHIAPPSPVTAAGSGGSPTDVPDESHARLTGAFKRLVTKAGREVDRQPFAPYRGHRVAARAMLAGGRIGSGVRGVDPAGGPATDPLVCRRPGRWLAVGARRARPLASCTPVRGRTRHARSRGTYAPGRCRWGAPGCEEPSRSTRPARGRTAPETEGREGEVNPPPCSRVNPPPCSRVNPPPCSRVNPPPCSWGPVE